MSVDLLGDAEARRIDATAKLDPKTQQKLGQFFTPSRASTLIAALPRLPRTGKFRILDPGAGSGSLSAAILARILAESPQLDVELVGVEMDSEVVPYLRRTFEDCAEVASSYGTKFEATIVEGDFVHLSTGLFDAHRALVEPFDLVIMNPPYLKLGSKSAHRLAVSAIGADCPNLYAAFLALGVEALRDGGQLTAITPRSFANGPYFAQFRRFLLDRVALNRIHTFASRSTVFADVLQETIVVSGTRGGARADVTIAVSSGGSDDVATERKVPYRDVVGADDAQRFIRIMADDSDQAVAEAMAAMPSALTDIGLGVSTGKVVDFRARDLLRSASSPSTVPLVYPGNVRSGVVEWPREIRKPQALDVSTPALVANMLVPNGFYVLVKRFSAKEERRRIVAAVWNPADCACDTVAFENHLNVFHLSGAGMPRNVAVGLSYWLNSSIVDQFFRTFSGHTQVNATDLRTLRFPPLGALESLGAQLDAKLPEQAKVDELVASVRPNMIGHLCHLNAC